MIWVLSTRVSRSPPFDLYSAEAKSQTNEWARWRRNRIEMSRRFVRRSHRPRLLDLDGRIVVEVLEMRTPARRLEELRRRQNWLILVEIRGHSQAVALFLTFESLSICLHPRRIPSETRIWRDRRVRQVGLLDGGALTRSKGLQRTSRVGEVCVALPRRSIACFDRRGQLRSADFLRNVRLVSEPRAGPAPSRRSSDGRPLRGTFHAMR